MSDPAVTTPASCADQRDTQALRFDDARQRILSAVRAVSACELVPLRDALGRTLADDLCSPIDVPSHTNAAMDGYALAGADLPPEGSRELAVIGTAWAGRPFAGAAQAGQCVRIMTGAKMPDGTDTVVMQERVERLGDQIRVGANHEPGQHVRQAGEDLGVDQVAVMAGKRIDPAELGLLASLGIAEVRVRRRLRVAFFSTGDELRSVGQPLGEGDLYDSNRYTLHGMLRRLDVELIDLGVLPDRRETIRAGFLEAAGCADAIVTSGGVSVGEADFVKEILGELGAVDFWKIAMRPGRPLAFGKVGDATFFGLPGNPVAVMVTFYQFVRPALRRMMGQIDVQPLRFMVPCLSHPRIRPGRFEVQRGVLSRDESGRLVVATTGRQGSGILSSMSRANCFILIPEDCEGIEPGDLVEVEPFEGLV